MDLFSKDYIFVPIHGYLHWSLVLICHPGNVVQQEDYRPPDGADRPGDRAAGSPLLLHLDSLDGRSSPAHACARARVSVCLCVCF